MRNYINIGYAFVFAGLILLIATLNINSYRLTEDILNEAISDSAKAEAITEPVSGMLNKTYNSKFTFLKDYHKAVTIANDSLQNNDLDVIDNGALPVMLSSSIIGPLTDHSSAFLISILLLFTIGTILITVGQYFFKSPGIKNDHIFQKPFTSVGWSAIIFCVALMAFYIILYWYPFLLADWIKLSDPLSKSLNGGGADENFLYGEIYSIAVLLLGFKMFFKYRHSRYQQIRTISVTFFQLSFAFIIPEILKFLKHPSLDLKNIWPLDYAFFWDSNISELVQNGKIGIFMLVWGIILLIIAVPLFTYFFGKRWYCSWVCGCGGLAETAGDPFRQLSSKKIIAWKIERVLIYSILLIITVITALSLINYFQNNKLLGSATAPLQEWYGFIIGSVFAGVIGTGFYPVMGNRVWCRFGCPLAAIFGIIQRYQSRFRITTNGGQCISCGNCSTYCEMGIDVRSYAQKGQNIVRASCVGCGICAEVCPRGVLKLENGPTKGRIDNDPILIGNDSINVRL